MQNNVYVTEICARTRATSRALYEALREIFAIPPLDILQDGKKVLVWREENWGDDNFFAGPDIYYEAGGSSVLIVTETSKRNIRVVFGEDGSIVSAKIEFPQGSVHAALDVLEALRRVLNEWGMSPEEWEGHASWYYYQGSIPVTVADETGGYQMSPAEALEMLTEGLQE